MNTAKIRILESTFNHSFELQQFKRFIKEFFNEPEIFPDSRKIGIWKEYMDHISAYYKVGKYEDSEENSLIILAVELKRGKSVERARAMQRSFISKLLEENDFEAAIVAFYAPNETTWRLSFVRLDYTFTDKGLQLDLTPARRYSYLVGEGEPNHTAKAQLLPIFENDKINPSLDEIEKAFSVEKVTKDFFKQYKEKYIQLKEYLETDSAFIKESEKLGFKVEKFAEQFSKKLLGQLAFLYFLQKKGWLGVRILPEGRMLLESEYQKIYYRQDDAHRKVLEKVFEKVDVGKRKIIAKNLMELTEHEAALFSDCFVGTEHEQQWGEGNIQFIKQLFDTCKKSKVRNNFFHDFLQPLFYEALNKKRANHYFNLFNCKIPFLNGGLFEPLEGYHWRDVHFNIPNDLFSNVEEKGREADGILDIFERYNFTMNEDEPLEKEVAVDPEMLGKIFENLLDVKDRKSKGAYYTPREIVHYMCQESLAYYLTNEVGVPYEDIKEFILYGDLIKDTDSRKLVKEKKVGLTIKPIIYENIAKIDKALENVKVADPAVGSGAFPLGILSEIVRIRNNITNYLVKNIKEDGFRRKIREEIIRKKRTPFRLKWDTIKNSIFAVDIEPSAVDITKLRLWLSVVVDQEITEETPEPQPLPNLDMNIMVGNSLIDEYEGIKLFDESILQNKTRIVKENKGEYAATLDEQLSFLIDYSDDMLEEMFKLQDRYFGEENEENKKEIKKKIDQLRDDLIEYKLIRDGNDGALIKYRELKKLKQKPYFLWYLEFAKVFQEKSGFDIVIGNPPYIGEKGNELIFHEVSRTDFGRKYYSRWMDYFYFFFHKSINLVKNRGIISFITTNYFITANGANKLRYDFKERTVIKNLTNFNELRIFESAKGQHNLITILEKNGVKSSLAKTSITNHTGDANTKVLMEIVKGTDSLTDYYEVQQEHLYDGEELLIRINGTNNPNVNDPTNTILNKMVENSDFLGEICNIMMGIISRADKVSNAHLKKYPELKVSKGDGIFILTQNELEALKLNQNDIDKYVRPLYKNSDIKKYKIPSENKYWLLYIKDTGKPIKLSEELNNHFEKFKTILVKGKENFLKNKIASGFVKKWLDNGNYFVLFNPKNEEDFTKPNIVAPYRSKENTFAYSERAFFAVSDVCFISTKDVSFDLKYILALLNSKLYYFWFYHKGKRKGKIFELNQTPLKGVPIKKVEKTKQEPFVKIVNKIISLTNEEDYDNNEITKGLVFDYQNQLDELIYKLFDLTEEETNFIKKLS